MSLTMFFIQLITACQFGLHAPLLLAHPFALSFQNTGVCLVLAYLARILSLAQL